MRFILKSIRRPAASVASVAVTAVPIVAPLLVVLVVLVRDAPLAAVLVVLVVAETFVLMVATAVGAEPGEGAVRADDEEKSSKLDVVAQTALVTAS
jgi:hypothetical protein